MDKYGVEIDTEKTKQANEGATPNKCPLCGRDLDSGGACPEHGTEPFERKTDPNQK